MSYERSSLLSLNKSFSESGVSISLNDSWTGKKLLEALKPPLLPARRFSPEEFDMRYQQKQLMEREQRKSEFTIGSGRIGGGSLSGIDINENKLTATLGAGKVRQMFDERRHQQRTTGIDKSYPLQPITITSSNSSQHHQQQRKSPNGTSHHSNNLNGVDTKRNLMKLPTSAEATLENNAFRMNGNYLLTDGDILDNEQFPDDVLKYEETMSSSSNLSKKLPNVRKQLSGLSLNESSTSSSPNGIQLKPVVLAGGKAPLRSLNGAKKLAPVTGLVTPGGNSNGTNNGNVQLQSFKRSAPTPTSLKLSEPKSFNQNPSTPPSSKSKSITSNTPSSGSTTKSSAGSSRVTTPKSAKAIAVSGEVPDGMSSCQICGRNFNTDRIEKHETICEKTAKKKRKIFDATIHRVKGTEAEQFVKKAIKQKTIHQKKFGSTNSSPIAVAAVTKVVAISPSTVPNNNNSAGDSKKNDWRRKHEEFIAAIRSAKKLQAHLAKGGKLSDLPPPPPSENPDYVQCPHCNRRFNQSAAERHIPKCATFQHNKPKPKPRKKF